MHPRLLVSLLQWRPGALARAGVELTGWFLLRALAQSVVILTLARLLGAAEYGAFVAILAMASIAAPIAGLGLPSVILRDGARQIEPLPVVLGRALSIWWCSVLLFSAGTSIIATVTLPPIDAPLVAIHGMILVEIGSVSLIELLGRSFQARQDTRAYGLMQAGLPLVRLVAMGIAWLGGLENLGAWLWFYIAASLIYMLGMTGWTYHRIGWKRSIGGKWNMIREGLPFTSAGLSMRLQAEFNKPLLAQTAYAHAGNFNIAQRAVDLVSLPILAVQEALWPRLYADADHRRRLIVAGSALVLMGLCSAVLITAIAPLAPLMLGEDFKFTVAVMQWLALLPLFSVLRSIGNFQLIATERTHLLTWVYSAGGVTGLVAGTLLIPTYSLEGAAWTCYISESASLLLILVFLSRRA